MTEPRRGPSVPAHLVVMLSASTAAYAVFLAGVAGLQAGDEATIAAARQPVLAGVREMADGHDRLATALEGSREMYRAVSADYEAVGARIGLLESTLAAFATSVAELDGQARALPTSFRLPAARSVGRVTAAPATQGSTGASGG